MADDAFDRRIEWATRTLTQGEILAEFSRHCHEELDDVEVLDAGADHLVARWREEESLLALRRRITAAQLPSGTAPTMLLGDIEADLEALVDAFVNDAGLRNRLALYDLGRLEKVGAVRSSVFVYFEWFLRDEYGVKLLPAAAFTQRLIDRGVIHLGFG